MRRILRRVLWLLLALFVVAILGVMALVGYFFFADPFGLRDGAGSTETPLASTQPEESARTSDESVESAATPEKSVSDDRSGGAHPVLSDREERAFETVGIDPQTLPTSLSPEMRACFEGILGAQRVVEIIGGSLPTATEVLRAKSCL